MMDTGTDITSPSPPLKAASAFDWSDIDVDTVSCRLHNRDGTSRLLSLQKRAKARQIHIRKYLATDYDGNG